MLHGSMNCFQLVILTLCIIFFLWCILPLWWLQICFCISFGWVWYFNYSCINFASNYCYLYRDKGRHWFYYRCQCVCFFNSHFDIFCDIIPWHVTIQRYFTKPWWWNCWFVYEYESSCTCMSGMQWSFQSRLEKICYIVTMEFACKLPVLVPMTCFSVTLIWSIIACIL